MPFETTRFIHLTNLPLVTEKNHGNIFYLFRFLRIKFHLHLPRIMAKEEEKDWKENTVPAITELFMKNGIKSMTMDDIARELSVSKKTLYKFVDNKHDLVKQCAIHRECQHIDHVEAIMSKNLNAIDEMYEITDFVIKMLLDIHPSIFYDLEKYYPEAFKSFNEFKGEFISKCIVENINKGIKEELYRNDANPQLIGYFYSNLIDAVLQSQHSKDCNEDIPRVQVEAFRYHMRGIASEKGFQYLKKIKTQLLPENNDK